MHPESVDNLALIFFWGVDSLQEKASEIGSESFLPFASIHTHILRILSSTRPGGGNSSRSTVPTDFTYKTLTQRGNG